MIENVGKHCTVIIGHKEIKGIKKVRKLRVLEEYNGRSVEIFPYDDAFTCLINYIGVPSSVGIGNAGKDVTIIDITVNFHFITTNWSW